MSRRIYIMATLPPSPFTSSADVHSAETLAVAPSPQAPVVAASVLFDSGATALSPDEAAASPGLQASDAAAEIPEPTSSTGGCQEASTPTSTVTVAAGGVDATDCIGEIFAGARKLEQLPGIFDQAAYTPADELLYVTLKAMDDPWAADLIDIPEGLWLEFDPPPLFLRQA